MFKVIHGKIENYSDVSAFVKSIQENELVAVDFFNNENPIFVTRAPGRLDIMGGMADYSGATVFEETTEESIICALQTRKDTGFQVRSFGRGQNDFDLKGNFTLDDLLSGGQVLPYEKIRDKFSNGKEDHWLAFPAGAFAAIMHEKKHLFKVGANILLLSTVPMGQGVGSSAALEISLLKAIVEAFKIPASHRDIPYIAHVLENRIVDSPCGMMDQYASSHGVEGHILPIVCQPDTVLDPVPVKEDITIVGVDTGIPSNLPKDKYAEVRTAAFMGYRIIADKLGLKVNNLKGKPIVEIDDPYFDGYLANIRTSRFDADFRNMIPYEMSGSDFIKQYKGITDKIVTIQPDKTYEIRVACQNQVYENLRTVLFLQLLRAYVDNHNEQLLISLGELMFLSHRSYRQCGLANKNITELVREIRIAGPRVGLYGAKITGSGTRSVVAILLKKTAMPTLKNLLQEFSKKKKVKHHIYAGNSPGAIEFDHLEMKWFD